MEPWWLFIVCRRWFVKIAIVQKCFVCKSKLGMVQPQVQQPWGNNDKILIKCRMNELLWPLFFTDFSLPLSPPSLPPSLPQPLSLSPISKALNTALPGHHLWCVIDRSLIFKLSWEQATCQLLCCVARSVTEVIWLDCLQYNFRETVYDLLYYAKALPISSKNTKPACILVIWDSSSNASAL